MSTLEEEAEKNTDLHRSVAQDVAPHRSIDDHRVSAFWHSTLDDVSARWLSSEGQSSKGVHDEVYPKHLNRSEGCVVKDERAGEDNKEGDNVNGHLELKEFSNVVKSRSAVFHCTKNRAEVVIKQLDVSSVLGNVGSCYPHCKANV